MAYAGRRAHCRSLREGLLPFEWRAVFEYLPDTLKTVCAKEKAPSESGLFLFKHLFDALNYFFSSAAGSVAAGSVAAGSVAAGSVAAGSVAAGAAGACSVTAGAAGSTGAASSFLPQAAKATANKDAIKIEFFMFIPFGVTN